MHTEVIEYHKVKQVSEGQVLIFASPKNKSSELVKVRRKLNDHFVDLDGGRRTLPTICLKEAFFRDEKNELVSISREHYREVLKVESGYMSIAEFKKLLQNDR